MCLGLHVWLPRPLLTLSLELDVLSVSVVCFFLKGTQAEEKEEKEVRASGLPRRSGPDREG